MVESVVIDGEYDGYYVTDFLNVSTNKDTGALYVSPKGKLSDLLQAELTDDEYNNLADKLAAPETTDDKCLEIIAKALKNAKDPRFMARVRQTDPNDPKVKEVSNKLMQDSIFPYMPPEQKEAQTKAQAAKTEAELDELQYDEDDDEE